MVNSPSPARFEIRNRRSNSSIDHLGLKLGIVSVKIGAQSHGPVCGQEGIIRIRPGGKPFPLPLAKGIQFPIRAPEKRVGTDPTDIGQIHQPVIFPHVIFKEILHLFGSIPLGHFFLVRKEKRGPGECASRIEFLPVPAALGAKLDNVFLKHRGLLIQAV